jgi:peptidoglycan/xylan/chitin deacetylase (PgdA/CDA1 family)
MQLSRSKRAVLFGAVLLAVGLTGRASADTTPSAREPQAAPAASVPAPAPTKPAVKPKPKQKPKQKAPVRARNVGGPAGARTTTGSKAVALTFDDGPDATLTPQILRLLAKQRVRATFCVVGKNVQRHPALVRQIVAGGHTLCNHTWDHSMKLGKEPEAKIRADLQRTNDAIHRAAPKAKIKYFRAPGGKFTPRLVGVAKQMGMTSIYWKVDPRDWDHPKGETPQNHRKRVIWHVARYTHQGAIVLSHDYAQPETIAAYRKLIPWLKRRYQLIALP